MIKVMNIQVFTYLIFVISVTVTLAARITDYQIAQMLNENLGRGPASEYTKYVPLDDISELKRRAEASENPDDITDLMLDTENGQSGTEEVLHNPNGRKGEVSPRVLEGHGRLPSSMDDQDVLSEVNRPNEVDFFDNRVGDNNSPKYLRIPGGLCPSNTKNCLGK